VLKDILYLQMISFKFYCGILILFGVFMTGITAYNSENILSYAKYETRDSAYHIEISQHYQPKIMSISNQVDPSFSKISTAIASASASPTVSTDSNSNISTFTENSEFRKDITGKYSNPKYGITDFEIPSGWFATESMNGDNGIVLTMLPGTTEEFFTKLNSLSNNETLPVMNLIVQDRQDLRERQMSSSSYNTESSSFSTECTELSSNSTTTINDKQFQISTMKCSKADKAPIGDGIDFGHDEITKSYKYDSPATMYVLQLLLSSDYSSIKIINEGYLSKFQPVIDDAIQTLKIG
jgi:hypothetical protein